MDSWGVGRRARLDKADLRRGQRLGTLEEVLVDGGNGSEPFRFEIDKVLPVIRCWEARWVDE